MDPGTAVNFHQIAEESKSKKDRPRPIPPKPGEESRRKTVEAQKPIDNKYHGQVFSAVSKQFFVSTKSYLTIT